MKKYLLIFILFAMPLGIYLFFASGVNNFARLPVLTQEIDNIDDFKSIDNSPEEVTFNDKITILSFPGAHPLTYKNYAYHLNEKIYDKYSGFDDFQFVSVIPSEAKAETEKLKEEMSRILDFQKWHFITSSSEEIKSLFNSLGTNLELDENLATPYVFIIDKNGKLRGRDQDDDDGKELYGYDAGSIFVLNNKMNDDVKIILAEYRLELKKYKKAEAE